MQLHLRVEHTDIASWSVQGALDTRPKESKALQEYKATKKLNIFTNVMILGV